MSGIKDLHSLLFWLDNSKLSNLEMALSNTRHLPREKVSLLREIREDGLPGKGIKNEPARETSKR